MNRMNLLKNHKVFSKDSEKKIAARTTKKKIELERKELISKHLMKSSHEAKRTVKNLYARESY